MLLSTVSLCLTLNVKNKYRNSNNASRVIGETVDLLISKLVFEIKHLTGPAEQTRRFVVSPGCPKLEPGPGCSHVG